MSDQLPQPVTAPFSAAQKTSIRNLVRRAVRAEIMPRFRRLDAGEIAEKTSATDLVTAADLEAEAIITRGLQRMFPHAVIVGEEAVSKNPGLLDQLGDAELSFLIDPVDGTWNFAQGLSTFATMVAACRFGRPVYGVIHDPIGDDAMEADLSSPSHHLFMGGRTRMLHTAQPKPVEHMMGYMQWGLLQKDMQHKIAGVLPDFQLVTTYRCSAHEYRMLAQGAVDFVLSVRMTPWDHAAGVLLCGQAGGHVSMLDGRDYTAVEQGYLLCASSKNTWDAVAERFKALLA